MRHSPDDPGFNAMTVELVLGNPHTPKIFYVDHDNQVREVVYPEALEDGASQVEARLRAEGELKAVVYTGFPSKQRHRVVCLVRYLPDNQIYRRAIDVRSTWLLPLEPSMDPLDFYQGKEKF